MKNPRTDKCGIKRWYNKEGQLHRVNGPAVEYSSGGKEWWQNGKLHRLNGPAVEYSNGTKLWYQNSKWHRLDGPAIEYSNGSKAYYVDGEQLTKEEFIERTELPVKYLSNVKPQNRWDALYEE